MTCLVAKPPVPEPCTYEEYHPGPHSWAEDEDEQRPPRVGWQPPDVLCCDHYTAWSAEDCDIECCLCTPSATHGTCKDVTVSRAIQHGRWREERQRVENERTLAYVLEHGHLEPLPF